MAYRLWGWVLYVDWKMFATALGGGILLDATLIRGVLAPAAVAILGRGNWWMPGWAARLLRVAPQTGPAPAAGAGSQAAPQTA